MCDRYLVSSVHDTRPAKELDEEMKLLTQPTPADAQPKPSQDSKEKLSQASDAPSSSKNASQNNSNEKPVAGSKRTYSFLSKHAGSSTSVKSAPPRGATFSTQTAGRVEDLQPSCSHCKIVFGSLKIFIDNPDTKRSLGLFHNSYSWC